MDRIIAEQYLSDVPAAEIEDLAPNRCPNELPAACDPQDEQEKDDMKLFAFTLLRATNGSMADPIR